MKKRMIPTLKYWCVFLFSFLLLGACKGDSEPVVKEDLSIPAEDEIEWKIGLDKFLETHSICVVLNQKNCKSCNESLVNICDKFLAKGDRSFGVVVETTGSVYNISSLLKKEYEPNVFHDFRGQLTKKFDAKNSFILYYPGGFKMDKPERIEVTTVNLDIVEAKLNEFLSEASK